MALSWVIKDYMDIAARECSITPPSNWVTASDTNSILIRTYLTDTVRELIARHDWNQLNRDQSITGDGSTSYALASDYLRLARSDNAVFENGPNERPCVGIQTNGDWTEINEANWAGVQRFYRLQGSNIEFFQALPTDGEVTISYISKNWKTASDGATPGTEWMVDTDLSLLPGPLLQLGVVWRFKRHKRLYYADFKAEYESEFAREMSNDKPVGKVAFDGERGLPRNPFDVPVPDFIPSS